MKIWYFYTFWHKHQYCEKTKYSIKKKKKKNVFNNNFIVDPENFLIAIADNFFFCRMLSWKEICEKIS